jgi:hypothetical protein
MMYSAFALRLEGGTTGLCLFFDGFDSEDDAEQFLSHLLTPFEMGIWPESDILH